MQQLKQSDVSLLSLGAAGSSSMPPKIQWNQPTATSIRFTFWTCPCAVADPVQHVLLAGGIGRRPLFQGTPVLWTLSAVATYLQLFVGQEWHQTEKLFVGERGSLIMWFEIG